MRTILIGSGVLLALASLAGAETKTGLTESVNGGPAFSPNDTGCASAAPARRSSKQRDFMSTEYEDNAPCAGRFFLSQAPLEKLHHQLIQMLHVGAGNAVGLLRIERVVELLAGQF